MSKDTGIVHIHGKEYQTVASRVAKFRDEHKDNYSIVTHLVSADEKTVVMKAHIYKLTVRNEKDIDGVVYTAVKETLVATGYAEENRASSTINKTSALENCETSAIGRALAAFGMAGTEYASADEVAQAISQQGKRTNVYPEQKPQLSGEATEKQKALIYKHLEQQGVAVEDMEGYLIEQYGVTLPLTKQIASELIDEIIAAPVA